ncbi:hypothetical protein [Streptomyces zagrosensis]|uniref:Uncharacterized protein n=1 Tax=Streptomyces zagrosensis TaxID=1042984 RepID=A0A7W9V0A8_9ACTN|nr:hypothetical protein [Streptomyces zagrosensis]MBB5936614.1 hypothetical protein [Streptomyces zagrosensis]
MPTETNTPITPPHDWMPPGGGVRWTRVGDLGWHTLTLTTYLGNRVLAHLGEASGAVIQEDIGRQMTWLTEPHAPAVQHLRDDSNVTISGDDSSYVFVPGMTRTDLVWWRVMPTSERLLTDASRLAGAIDTVRNSNSHNRPAETAGTAGGAA